MNYNFVSNGKDDLKDAAFFVDENIGFSQSEMAIFKKDFFKKKTTFDWYVPRIV